MHNLLFFLFALSWLNQGVAMSLPNHLLKDYECTHCDSLSHTPLSTSWPITDKLFKRPITKQESLKYHFEATAAQLHHGVPIYTLAPRAIIRITPKNKKIILHNFQLHLTKEPGRRFSFLKASTLSQIKSSEGCLVDLNNVIELKPELGSGQFTLSLTDFNILESEPFQIRIFDKASTAFVRVETNHAYYQYGDELITTVFLSKDNQRCLANSIKASLLSPNGERIPINLTEIEPTLYRGKVKLENEKNFPGQNWYVETDVSAKIGDQTFNRHAHTAFSYAIPSARIKEIIKLNSPLKFSAKIKVATGSRYMLQAVLFKGDAQGKKQAIEIAQTANWLAPGYSTLTFSFKHKIDNSEHSPYYLGSIQLIDYGQLKPVFEHNSPIDISNLG